MRRMLAVYQHRTLIIPLKDDISPFILDGDAIKYSSPLDLRSMLCFSTEIVDPEKYGFSFTTITQSRCYGVGVIAEKDAH